MRLTKMPLLQPTLYGLVLLGLHARLGCSLEVSYCSNQNTAPDDTEQNNIYNSNGACQTHCQANYAFAIVQYQSCWCSNYIPADTTNIGDCNQQCPGFPKDKCGNAMNQLYGYIALSILPSGTLGATPSPSAVQPSATEPMSTVAPPTTNYVSETVSVIISVTPSPETSIEVSYVTPVPSTHLSVSTTTPAAFTSVRIVYISGAPVTQTVTSTPIVQPNSNSDTAVTEQRKTGISGGAVAGIALGVLFGVAAIVLAAFLLWRRRRSQDGDQTTDGAAGPGPRNNPRRNVSVLSKTGLLARARPSMGERDHDEHYYIPPLTSHGSIRQSMVLGLGGEAMDPSSPLGGSQAGSDTRRHSKPFIYDQRLNPSALYANHDNGSRDSMQDNNDYSRPLGITNPDTRPSFESHNSR